MALARLLTVGAGPPLGVQAATSRTSTAPGRDGSEMGGADGGPSSFKHTAGPGAKGGGGAAGAVEEVGVRLCACCLFVFFRG